MTLRIVELLRNHGVVGKFVEFYGNGMSALSLPDRATIANMAPEYGATCGFFPVDDVTLEYMRLSEEIQNIFPTPSHIVKHNQCGMTHHSQTPNILPC